MEVRYGPFAGMNYTREAAAERIIIPKLLGSFEKELHSVWNSALEQNSYETIIDIGCAEGYYSTGFATRTTAQVVAFDIEPRELSFAQDMAKTNGVRDRIRFAGWCTTNRLVQEARGRTLILSDCEGYESKLFTREVAGRLKRSDLLIELHGEAQELLPPILSESHDVTLIGTERRSPAQFSELEGFGPELAALALCEHRDPAQQWLWAEARRPD
jgi:Methyltransferase domain